MVTDESFENLYEAPNWVHVTLGGYTRSVNSTSLRIAIDENTSFDSREGDIIFKQGTKPYYFNDQEYKIGSTGVKIHIIQATKGTIILENKQFSIDDRGGNITVPVQANIDFDVSVSPESEWIKQVTNNAPSRGLVTTNLVFSIAPITPMSDTPQSRTASITLENKENKIKEIITITQKGEFYITETSIELVEGKSKKLSCKRVGYSEEKNVLWSSSNEEVATVDANGLVTAKTAGTCIITASNELGYKSSCKTIVKSITSYITISPSLTISSEGNYSSITIENNSQESINVSKAELYYNGQLIHTESSIGIIEGGKTKVIGINGLYSGLVGKVYFTYNGKNYIVSNI